MITHDPLAIPNAKKILRSNIEYTQSPTQCIRNADCCITVTEWDEFKGLKPEA